MLGIILLACHMVGDYIAQNDWMAANKLKDWKVRAIHVTCYCFCFLPAIWYAHQSQRNALLFIFWLYATHFATDSRRWASGERWAPKPILVDQSIHIATLAILGVVFLEKA